MTSRFAVFGLVIAALFASGSGVARADFVYGIDDNRDIWEFDTTAKSQSKIFSTGQTTGQPNSLAYDSVRNQLMFRNPGTPGTNSPLYLWDRVSSSVKQIATPAQLGSYDSASAAYYDDAYYFFDDGTSNLIKIGLNYSGTDPIFSTKTEAIVKNSGAALSFGDIAINADTGFLYGATTDGRFFSLNLASPTASYVQIKTGNISLQLAFSADYTTLYGHSYNTGQWYTMNLATGIATEIPNFVTTRMRDLGGSAATPFNPVPEPSNLLLLGIGGASLLIARRRVRKTLAN